MANFTELDQFDEYIYQIDTQDPVLGGPDGTSNKQGKALANRTNWLKLRLAELTTAFNNFTQSVAQSFAQVYTKSEVYTKTETENRIASLVNSAPTTLDTLKELSDALGSDPNFATTMATALGNRYTKSETESLDNAVKDYALNTVNAGLLTKVIPFTWDMVNDGSCIISHNLDVNKIVSVEAFINNNGLNMIFPINYMDNFTTNQVAGNVSITNASIFLFRRNSGFFAGTTFSGTSVNRGRVIIKHLP